MGALLGTLSSTTQVNISFIPLYSKLDLLLPYAWHGDFVKPSDKEVLFPLSVNSSLLFPVVLSMAREYYIIQGPQCVHLLLSV